MGSPSYPHEKKLPSPSTYILVKTQKESPHFPVSIDGVHSTAPRHVTHFPAPDSHELLLERIDDKGGAEVPRRAHVTRPEVEAFCSSQQHTAWGKNRCCFPTPGAARTGLHHVVVSLRHYLTARGSAIPPPL